ncbi:(Fe-S)-binding protein [Capnocytophaga sp. oral taxon 863]|uniref:(Fe-S)-binding protein n=1 Tax=Capnocytophaga sp. oral taxon 863 TaxID=1227265 RepID=UPI000411E429|nr:(Fe-S)-binding protein [Capnocytophaga sp. oral taxon 863]
MFILLVIAGIALFVRNMRRLRHNIRLGTVVDTSDHKRERLIRMLRLALGQGKMGVRPVAGLLHLFVYVGFIIINIEVLEILIDGIFSTHRAFGFMGGFYNFLIGAFECLALLVLVGVVTFYIRRNVLKISRFHKKELQGSAQRDANIILYAEMVMMSLFLVMNACDYLLQIREVAPYAKVGAFPVSQWISPLFASFSTPVLIAIERTAWWGHIIGIFAFLNYLYYSKHLHILLAFPYTYYAPVKPKGELNNLPSVTREVQLMLGTIEDNGAEEPTPTFGASDIMHLSRTQLLAAYSCTECGRCTDECPANQTGKLLSPRKIMMDTRRRTQEVGENIRKHKGVFQPDNKQLLGDYITPEELWACTTCAACVEACPMEINPLSIIMDMRRYIVMEQSAAPTSLNKMMTQIENTSSPWGYHPSEREKVWKE